MSAKLISECRKFGVFLLISDLSSFDVKNEREICRTPKNVSSIVRKIFGPSRDMLPQKNFENYVSKIS